MLELPYDTATLEIRAWNAEMSVKGNLKPLVPPGQSEQAGQVVIILDIDPPTFENDSYRVDLITQKIVVSPDYALPKVRNAQTNEDNYHEW